MRVVFIGSTKRGFQSLQALYNSPAAVVGVISLKQDKHEKERYEVHIRKLSEENNTNFLETKRMKDRNYLEILANKWKPDVIFIVGCRILISKDIYEIPDLGCLAVHDSPLPHYRGFAPLNWAIINGEECAGVTLFYLNEQMDGGDIALQETIPIAQDETAPMLYDKICSATVDLVRDAVERLMRNALPRTPQNYNEGSFTCSRTPIDGMIDWSWPSKKIYDMIRALTSPYPGAYTIWDGKKLIIWEATIIEDSRVYVGRIPGRVIGFNKKEGWAEALTGDGILRITKVQQEDSNQAQDAASVLNSVKKQLGLDPGTLLNLVEMLSNQGRS